MTSAFVPEGEKDGSARDQGREVTHHPTAGDDSFKRQLFWQLFSLPIYQDAACDISPPRTEFEHSVETRVVSEAW